ncbi:DNA polymerase beta superfamily protein [Sandaracinus amylolyticus]|nr:nucleotidyltransferase domain-containing protein [Sandaracinus amylolyticus]
MIETLLDAHARDVARRVIAEESARREHVVVYLSGAHAYGFPSPDSDLDLKCIHVAPTRALLGLAPPVPTFDRAEILDGVEIDYTSNELGHALTGILRGNGNFLERVLGSAVLAPSSMLERLREIGARSLSRRVHRHYRGFAESQLRELDKRPTVKRLLYVMRTALTGTHLLETGTLITDLPTLLDAHDQRDAAVLIERKRAGERTPLEDAERTRWRARVDALFTALDDALARSPLPEAPQNEAELDAFLIEARRARL